MALTKAQTRTLVQQWIDDPNAQRWSAVNLDLLISLTQDDLWQDLLLVAPWANSQLDTLASLTSPGYVDLRTVADGGDLSERFYRLQQLTRNGRHYGKGSARLTLIEGGSEIVSDSYSYVFYGSELHLFPYETDADTEIRYSYLPGDFNSLQDGDAINFPDGHEMALVFESAARAMLKGAAEDVAQLASFAADAKRKLFSAFGVRDGNPQTIELVDSAMEWGSEA